MKKKSDAEKMENVSNNVKFELENGELWFDLDTINQALSIPQKINLLDRFFENNKVHTHFITLFKDLLREKFQTEDFMKMYENISKFLMDSFPDKKVVIYDILSRYDSFEIFYAFITENTKSIKVKDEIVFKDCMRCKKCKNTHFTDDFKCKKCGEKLKIKNE